MKILRFEATGLHGYLNFNLDFAPDLTFLTGINGSGKTSAVRAITALLTPSLASLAEMDYSVVAVHVEHDAELITISSTHTDEELSLSCNFQSETVIPLSIPILKNDTFELPNRMQDRRKEYYREQETIYGRHPAFEKIRSLPTPMFLDLERRYQDVARTRSGLSRYSYRSGGTANPLGGTLTESLSHAQGLAEEAYRDYLAQRSTSTDKLKQDLILSAFNPIHSEADFYPWKQEPEFIGNLRETERLVLDSLPQIGIAPSQLAKIVAPFFKRVRETALNLPSEQDFATGQLTSEQIDTFQSWSALQPRVRQIDSISHRITQYSRELSKLYASIGNYIDIVNRFLSDSSKHISFDVRGDLKIYVEGDHAGRNINSLSSGERQIVVILTHLAFNKQAKRANILIIDEPELSLHLRWQELFVDAVTSASSGLQLILATHSPSIIKGKFANCVDVREEWRDASVFT